MQNMKIRAGMALMSGLIIGVSMPAVFADGQSDMPPMPRIIQSQQPIILPPPAYSSGDMYQQAVPQVAPMTPAQIRFFRSFILKKENALYGATPPKMANETYEVSLAPGAPIPVIKLTPGFVGSIVFLDEYGNPWPIDGQPAIGDGRLYRVIVPETKDRNVITISALKFAGASDLSVTLKGQSIPIIIQLSTSMKTMNIRADMKIGAAGPNTNPLQASSAGIPPAPATPDMMDFVDGVPPQGAIRLKTSSNDIQAWEYNQMLYLRTTDTVFTPQPLSISYGGGGLRVYRVPPAPVVLYSQGGQVKSLKVHLKQVAADAAAGQ